MRIYINLITILAVLLIGSCSIDAADGSTKKLSLAEAVNAALRDNIALNQAKASRLDSSARLRIANLQTSYSVGSQVSLHSTESSEDVSSRVYGGFGFENPVGTTASLNVIPFAMGEDSGSLSVQIRHPLMQGSGKYSSKFDEIQTAKNALDINELELYRSKQSLVLSVISGYYSAVLSGEQVKVKEQALQNTEILAEGTSKRIDAGLAAGIELSRAEISVEQARNELVSGQQNAQAALDSLMLTMGQGIGQQVELTDSVPEPDKLPALPALEEAVSRAYENRTELNVYDRRLIEQERKLGILQDNLRYGLDAFVGFSSGSYEDGIISTSILDEGAFSVGLEFSMPIDKRVDKENLETSKRSLGLAREQRAYRAEQIAEEVRDAYRSVQTLQKSLSIYERNLQSAKDSRRFAERRIEEGLADNRDLVESEEAVTRAALGLQSAKINLYLAHMDLLYAMGEDLTKMELP